MLALLKAWWGRRRAVNISLSGVLGGAGALLFLELRGLMRDRVQGAVNDAIDNAVPGPWAVFAWRVVDGTIWFLPLLVPLGYIAVTLGRAYRDQSMTAQAAADALTVSEGWLEGKLIEADFDKAASKDDIEDCLRFLHIAGLFWQADVTRFLENQQCRNDIQGIYREELRDPARILDPYGYCFWGPRLHRASDRQRPAVLAHLRVEIRKFLDRATGQEMTQEAYLDARIAQLQARRARVLKGRPT